jgi:hypothetical protein
VAVEKVDHSKRVDKKNVPGSSTNDVLNFPDILYPPILTVWQESWSFSTATRDSNS